MLKLIFRMFTLCCTPLSNSDLAFPLKMFPPSRSSGDRKAKSLKNSKRNGKESSYSTYPGTSLDVLEPA
uniref:Putative secreted protein n=1 Tax=Anopheles darlingi TaxID=43151 RepID=A0A2M4DJ85_ANODA